MLKTFALFLHYGCRTRNVSEAEPWAGVLHMVFKFQGNLSWEIIFPSADSAPELSVRTVPCGALHKQPLVIHQQELLRTEWCGRPTAGRAPGAATSCTYSHNSLSSGPEEPFWQNMGVCV